MKVLSFSVLAVIFFTGNVTAAAETHNIGDIEPYIFEDVINKTIEALRPYIPDPLTIENLSFNLTFNEDILNGFLQISKPTLAGLKGFQVPSLNLAVIGMRLNITLLLHIDVSLEYLLDTVVLDLLPIYGGGDAGVHHLNLELTISSQADLKANPIQLQNFHLQIGLADTTDFFINGFLYDQNSSTLLTQLVNEAVLPEIVTLIDDNQAIISEKLSPIVQDTINELLKLIGNKTVTEDSLRESFEEFLHDDHLHDLLPDLVTTLFEDSSEDIPHFVCTFIRDFVFEMLSTHKIDGFLGDLEMLENHEIDAFLTFLQQKLADNGATRLHLP